jgi:hypothetical protein
VDDIQFYGRFVDFVVSLLILLAFGITLLPCNAHANPNSRNRVTAQQTHLKVLEVRRWKSFV